MDFWKILSLITAAGVVWLVYQQRKQAKAPVTSASKEATPPAAPSTEDMVSAMLAADK